MPRIKRYNCRYRKAFFYCRSSGYRILIEKKSNSGNIQSIRVSSRLDKNSLEVIIRLEPRRYRSTELLSIIQNRLPLL